MLELTSLSGGYKADADVLQNISLSVNKGELVTIIGNNGSGKSTLLRLILGIIRKTKGEVILDGRPLGELSRRDRAQRIAYLSQGRDTPDMTVQELVLHGRFPYVGIMSAYSREDRRIADDALEKMALREYAHTPLCELSGGMRQRAYIAMALCQEADYVLLDEPTSHLDVVHRLELMNVLKTLKENGRGILMVIHDLPLAFEYSDRIAVMCDGQLTAIDSPRALCDTAALKNAIGVNVSFDGTRYYCTMN